MKSLMPQVSLFFSDKQYHLGELTIDAMVKENHEFKAQVSEHPTESGESFCDHVHNLPLQIHIDGIISNTPMTMVGLSAVYSISNFLAGRSNNLAEEAFKKLEEIFAKREPITIATSLKEYKHMVLESLSIERGGGDFESLHFKATAKQVRLVNQALIDIPAPKVERAKPKQKMGKQETVAASEELEQAVAKKQSLLNKLFK